MSFAASRLKSRQPFSPSLFLPAFLFSPAVCASKQHSSWTPPARTHGAVWVRFPRAGEGRSQGPPFLSSLRCESPRRAPVTLQLAPWGAQGCSLSAAQPGAPLLTRWAKSRAARSLPASPGKDPLRLPMGTSALSTAAPSPNPAVSPKKPISLVIQTIRPPLLSPTFLLAWPQLAEKNT